MDKRPIITIFPDYGSAPCLWLRLPGGDGGVGLNCCDYSAGRCGRHPLSLALFHDLCAWGAEFGRAPPLPGTSDLVDLPADFNQRGLALAGRLKEEVGTAFRVLYLKGAEDPSRPADDSFEVMGAGRLKAITLRKQFRNAVRLRPMRKDRP